MRNTEVKAHLRAALDLFEKEPNNARKLIEKLFAELRQDNQRLTEQVSETRHELDLAKKAEALKAATACTAQVETEALRQQLRDRDLKVARLEEKVQQLEEPPTIDLAQLNADRLATISKAEILGEAIQCVRQEITELSPKLAVWVAELSPAGLQMALCWGFSDRDFLRSLCNNYRRDRLKIENRALVLDQEVSPGGLVYQIEIVDGAVLSVRSIDEVKKLINQHADVWSKIPRALAQEAAQGEPNAFPGVTVDDRLFVAVDCCAEPLRFSVHTQEGIRFLRRNRKAHCRSPRPFPS